MSEHLSFSQLVKFDRCEAEAMAELRGEWMPETGKALIVGKYFHAAFESRDAFEKIQQENAADIFKKNGDKYADFVQADLMIDKIRNDAKISFLRDNGMPEVEVREEFAGAEWICRIDCLNLQSNCFIDYKTVADIRKGEWITRIDAATGQERRRCVSFIEARHYDWQMALYGEILKRSGRGILLPIIVAVSKQEFPDIEVIAFDEKEGELEDALQTVAEKVPRILALKAGKIEPKRCGYCDYCRATQKIRKLKSFSEFKREVI